MCRDIELYWGEPIESARRLLQTELEIMKGYEEISLHDCSMKVAGELIELIIVFMFYHRMLMSVETSKLLSEDKALLYWAITNYNCVICEKPHADLAHYEAVSRGMSRSKVNHYGKHVLTLCREHHNKQYAIGVKPFDDKYHLHDSWMEVDEGLGKMLKGEKKE